MLKHYSKGDDVSFISVKNLSFSYNDEKVLDNLSIEIEKQDFLCITGVNGAGKSTFIKLLLGFLKPESGEIVFNDEKKLSYVSQNVLDVNKGLPVTVKELVSLSLVNNKNLSRKEKDKKVAEVLESINILDLQNKKIGELSGGQTQRVFIAKALLGETNCLILDEPTASIDKKAVNDICCLLGRLNKNGLTIIMITHDVSSIIYHSNRVLNFVEKTDVIEQSPQTYLEFVENLHKH